MKLLFDTTSQTRVRLENFDREAYQAKTGQAIGPDTVMLVNDTDQTIGALRMIWSTPNPADPARPHREILRSDIYSFPHLQPIMVAHSRTVIGAGTVLSADGKGFRDKSPVKINGDTTVTLDAVVLANGELIGPDTTGLAVDLAARTTALGLLQTSVRASHSRQALVDAKARRAQTREEVPITNALRRLAEQALRIVDGGPAQMSYRNGGQAMRNVESWLESMPMPPVVFRPGNQ